MNEKTMQNALSKIGYGLYVLSAKLGGKDNACIVNSFMQISSTAPTLCSLAVNKQSLTHEMVFGSKEFNISVITLDADFDFFKKFGMQSGRDVDKFSACKNIYRAKNGIIYIKKECNSYMSFEVIQMEDVGTHTLFLAKLVENAVLNDKESITYSYYHKHTKKSGEVKRMGYRCTICDYVLEEEELPADYICPLCSHGAEVFEKI